MVEGNLDQDLRLAVSCTSGQMGTRSACASLIGGMREISTSSVRWRGVERRREALRGSGRASLAHEGREPFDFTQDKQASAQAAVHIAGREAQISPFLIDNWRLGIAVTEGKQRIGVCSNRHSYGGALKRNCSPQRLRRGGTLAAVWGRRGGRRRFSGLGDGDESAIIYWFWDWVRSDDGGGSHEQ